MYWNPAGKTAITPCLFQRAAQEGDTNYDAPSAALAWQRTLTFFHQHLG
jgi:hypothetical protein